jgi:hypothetical protein
MESSLAKSGTVTDQYQVLAYLKLHAYGFRNKKKKREIIDLMPFSDRRFRAILSELINMGEVASDTHGCWYIPPVGNQDEVNAVIKSMEQRKKRAMNILKCCDKNINRVKDRAQQRYFAYAG